MGVFGFCERCGESVEVKVGREDRVQSLVVHAVEEQGEMRGWTAVQVLARQLVRLADFLGEAGALWYLFLPRAFVGSLWGLRETARLCFERGSGANCDVWGGDEFLGLLREDDTAKMVELLIGMQVGLFCAAEALGVVMGEDVDLTALAMERVERDVERGVRESQI